MSEKAEETSEAEAGEAGKAEKAEEERKEEAVRKPVRKEAKDVVEERFYRVPLRQAWVSPVKRRSPRAMRLLRGFIRRHMKVEDPVISSDVSEKVWSRGIEKPPRSLRVRVVKDKEGVVTVYLAD